MKESFNNGWVFYKDGENNKVPVTLPHDAMIYERRDPNCANADTTGYYPGGKYIYEKKLFGDVRFEGKYVALFFEGIYGKSKVLLNGVELISNTYGYTEFEVELKDLRIGEENNITVIADNSKTPNSRWYSGSGIYRPVSLIVENCGYIKDIVVETKSYVPAVIVAKCSDENAKVTIYDGDKIVAKGNVGEIEIPDAKLWSDETPNLYTAVFENEVDKKDVRFGVRKIEYSEAKGLLINGERTLLRGVCLHHDNGLLGACAFDEAERRRVRILKEAGFNAIRSAHNPCSRSLLNACDEYGMYVMDEEYDGWYVPKKKHDYGVDFDEHYLFDLTAMVKKDINHPSVILYSIGNEGEETVSEKGIKYAQKMHEHIRTIDDTRPVTCAVNHFINVITVKGMGLKKEGQEGVSEEEVKKQQEQMNGSAKFNSFVVKNLKKITESMAKSKDGDESTKGVFSKLDICGYNYGTVRYSMDHKLYPNRIIVGSETYLPDLCKNWSLVKKNPYIIGDFIWTGWDYIGEAGIGIWDYDGLAFNKPYPMKMSGSGIIDVTGEISPEVYFARCAYEINKELKMAVLPLDKADCKDVIKSKWRKTDAKESWSWDGYEGKTATVEVYSTAKKVELFLNGKKVGRKTPKDCVATFKVKYESGELKAVAFNGKENVGECVLRSATKNAEINVIPEKTVMRADGQDLIYVNLYVADENGIVRSSDDRTIEVNVAGAGLLQGIGSANPNTEEGFVGNKCKTFYGKAQAVVRSNGERGTITVKVSCDGLKEKTITLKAE